MLFTTKGAKKKALQIGGKRKKRRHIRTNEERKGIIGQKTKKYFETENEKEGTSR